MREDETARPRPGPHPQSPFLTIRCEALALGSVGHVARSQVLSSLMHVTICILLFITRLSPKERKLRENKDVTLF